MNRRIVDKIWFERATLVISGRGSMPCARFVSDGGGVFEPTECVSSGSRFELRFDVISGFDGRPLSSGWWRFICPDTDFEVDALPEHDYSCNGDAYSLSLAYENGGICMVSQLRIRPTSAKNRLITLLLRAAFSVCRPFRPRKQPRIIFTSESRSNLNGNMRYIYDELQRREECKHYQIIPFFCRPGVFSDYFKCACLLSTADIIITDDYHPGLYRLKYPDGVKVFQVWHACGAFKTVGYSRSGTNGSPRIGGPAHRCYTHAIVSSDRVRRYYSEAFGISMDRVYATGVPRTDALLSDNYLTDAKSLIKSLFGDLGGKRIILICPTFRGDGASSAYYPYEQIDFNALHQLCRRTDSVAIFKIHPFVKDPPPIPDRCRDLLFDGSGIREINDILAAADVIVTDYSSVIYEASILGKPMLFYTFDLEEYIASRDFYEPFDSFVPGEICRTFEELISRLDGEVNNSKSLAFRHRNFDRLDGKASARVVDLILGKE
ncbi:MAG: CDP-glycerol glycerophosphotransferase family protein [Firmicutes bacterium]|nr:CDP-glycerol glycerophosphotransferase family protein [Bacillota bacterium]